VVHGGNGGPKTDPMSVPDPNFPVQAAGTSWEYLK
jgi:hypothetical protein